jgi:hypothetical protein
LVTPLLAGLCLGAFAAHAQDATWVLNPSPGEIFNTPSNWTSGSVPTGTAFFGETTGINPIILLNSITLGQIEFTPSAPIAPTA